MTQSQLLIPSKSGTTSTYIIRKLEPRDLLPVKVFHESIFPLDYPINFYQNAVSDPTYVGLGVFHSEGAIVGCLVASFKVCSSLSNEEQRLLNGHPTSVCLYIMTLGVAPSLQRLGIGRQLLSLMVQQQRDLCPHAHCVYLHVLASNLPAVNFYLSCGFSQAGLLESYYDIDNQDHAALMLVMPSTNQHNHPGRTTTVTRPLSALPNRLCQMARQLWHWILQPVWG
eukprot:TRINITY_DN10670_c0_g1_i1.p1 TRINITY_DN10670_c0_g1~~TRINITY_DN10670_c0_g1_i1.p1  ORF type:complete len:226 (+),score=13.28 TRINITY_DN10670_c0_g1_i1:140-817(+)